MLQEQLPTEQSRISDQMRIDHIRTLRNSLIKDLLDERTLMEYFSTQFSHKRLNARRVVFIKKELQELLIAPVDLAHYAPLLLEMKNNGTASLANKNEKLFYDELDKIFKKYTF
jgi:hypothetical protein